MASDVESVLDEVVRPQLSAPTIAAVIEDKKKKKKKKKPRYARGTKDVQTANRGLMKASARLARAVAVGMTSYFDRSEKSARKRRDGANRDLAKNVTKALSKSIRRASEAPFDIARRLPNVTLNRQFRAGVRILIPFMR